MLKVNYVRKNMDKFDKLDIKAVNYSALANIAKRGQVELEQRIKSKSVTNESLNSVISSNSSTQALIEIKRPHSYVTYETGRRPGKMPPARELERWARLVLGNKNLAFAVAKNIGKFGDKAYRKGGLKIITKVINKIQNEISGQEFKKAINQFLK
jgi:hypothetical protein